MKILDLLLAKGRISFNTEKPPAYIGVSKLCCLNCAAAVRVLNRHLKTSPLEEAVTEICDTDLEIPQEAVGTAAHTSSLDDDDTELDPNRTPQKQVQRKAQPHPSPVQTRGSHLQPTLNWSMPLFLSSNRILKAEYEKELEQLKAMNPSRGLKHLAPVSPTPPRGPQPSKPEEKEAGGAKRLYTDEEHESTAAAAGVTPQRDDSQATTPQHAHHHHHQDAALYQQYAQPFPPFNPNTPQHAHHMMCGGTATMSYASPPQRTPPQQHMHHQHRAQGAETMPHRSYPQPRAGTTVSATPTRNLDPELRDTKKSFVDKEDRRKDSNTRGGNEML